MAPLLLIPLSVAWAALNSKKWEREAQEEKERQERSTRPYSRDEWGAMYPWQRRAVHQARVDHGRNAWKKHKKNNK